MTALAWRLSVGTLLGLAVFWYVGRPPFGDTELPDWLLPCCLVLGWAAPPPRNWLADAPEGRVPRWFATGTVLILVVLVGILAWGALATPSRHWDGAATWDARARVLAEAPTLAQPYFADPAVYCHSRDYPLLQPFTVAMLERVTGHGRLLFPLLFACLAALVFTGSRRKGVPAWLPWLMALACALTPMLVNTTSGGADSGYAELLLLTCTTAMTVAIARQWPLVLALGAMLAIAGKPEGLVYASLAVLVAFAYGSRSTLAGAVIGTVVGLLGWLPVRAQLHPGVATSDATGQVMLALAAAVVVADVLLRRTRAGTGTRWLLAAGCAALAGGALLLHPAAAGADTALGRYLAEPDRLLRNAAHLPAIAASFVEQGVLRLQFGATFVLPPLLWLLLRRRLPAPLCAASTFVALGLAAILLPFLLSPEPDLLHHLRSSMARLQLHWLGGAWLLSALLLPELLPVPQAVASGDGALRWLVPPGSRRDRFTWMAWLAVRKLREGPGPWLRAARLGVFQLLPAGVQEQLLRLYGHRQRSRALPPAAGPEVKGLVVVVLPVYRQAALLGAAIESVLAQTWQALELIVLDDGSGPEVAAVLARYAGEGRVRILRQDNRGLPQALDAAFELAQGEYWCWTSADNLMRPRMLEELVGFLQARPEVAMVYADYELIDGNGALLHGTDFRVASRAGPGDARVRLPRGTAALAVVPDNFIGPCFCYRGTVGRLLGGYSPEMGVEDYDYWLRVDGAFRIEHLGHDLALYRYRVHPDSLSGRATEFGIRQRLASLMARQRRRAAWFAAPLQFMAIGAGEWLRACLRPGETLVPEVTPGRKSLVVASAAALHRGPLPALPASAAAAVWFDSVAEVYAGHRLLGGDGVAAFTSDPAVAARLAVFTRTVFAGGRDAAALATARAFANDRTFQRGEWQQRQRPAPVPSGRPPRVLLLAEGFAQGGMEQVIADLAVGFRERGAAVAVLALRPAPGTAAALEQRGIDVIDPDAGRDGAALRRLLQEERFDVVSAHDCTAGADAAAAASVPFVQTIHGAYVWLPPERRARYRTADAHTAAYVAVSAAALEYADVQLELDVGKAVIVPTGIDLERWQTDGARGPAHPRRAELGLDAGDFVFLQPGTICPPKAQHLAIRALASVRAQEPRARLVCLGRESDPQYARLLRAEAERHGVAGAVVFAGCHADPVPFYQLADALVLPSFYEGCSLAVLEALAAGLPLVLSDVGAAAEQLELGSGCLVAPPFPVTGLDWTNLPRVLGREHPEYVARLADAMARALQLPRPPTLSAAQRWALDRSRMADAYLRLFGWLRQGGAPAAARAWLRRPAPLPDARPAAAMAASLSR